MKLLYTTKDGRLQVELEADSQSELWRELARFQEVFEETASGNVVDEKGKKYLATSDDIKFIVRTAEGVNDKGKTETYEYYEKVVVSGPLQGYKKSFGLLNDKSKGLFPKKAPEKDVIYGYNGWSKYNGPKKEYGKKHEEHQEEPSEPATEQAAGKKNVPF